MKYGEEQKYEIKSDTIYLNERFNPLLVDSGFIQCLVMTPQCEISRAIYDPVVDVYSFGMVMVELLTGSVHRGPSNELVPMHINPEVLRASFDEDAGPDWDPVKGRLSDLAISCVSPSVYDRPTSLEIKDQLTRIHRAMGTIVNNSLFPLDEFDEQHAVMICQLCNIPCNERTSIQCLNGHVVDRYCFCNRRRYVTACPICDVDIHPNMLISKIPSEVLSVMVLVQLTNAERSRSIGAVDPHHSSHVTMSRVMERQNSNTVTFNTTNPPSTSDVTVTATAVVSDAFIVAAELID
jgi:serine/threonine protein kinase